MICILDLDLYLCSSPFLFLDFIKINSVNIGCHSKYMWMIPSYKEMEQLVPLQAALPLVGKTW